MGFVCSGPRVTWSMSFLIANHPCPTVPPNPSHLPLQQSGHPAPYWGVILTHKSGHSSTEKSSVASPSTDPNPGLQDPSQAGPCPTPQPLSHDLSWLVSCPRNLPWSLWSMLSFSQKQSLRPGVSAGSLVGGWPQGAPGAEWELATGKGKQPVQRMWIVITVGNWGSEPLGTLWKILEHNSVIPPRREGSGILIYKFPSIVGWELLLGVLSPCPPCPMKTIGQAITFC